MNINEDLNFENINECVKCLLLSLLFLFIAIACTIIKKELFIHIATQDMFIFKIIHFVQISTIFLNLISFIAFILLFFEFNNTKSSNSKSNNKIKYETNNKVDNLILETNKIKR